MPTNFSYREGSLNDLPGLKALGLASYGQLSGMLDWKIMRNFLENDELYEDLLTRSYAFVCESDGTLVGMAYLVPRGNPTELYPADWSYIRMVGVHPDHLGKGIAKYLTRLCIEKAKQEGEKIIGLHTSEVMNAARHIYESFGFKIEKDIPPRYGVKYWLYKLDL